MDGIDGASYVKAIAYLSSAFAIGIGVLGPSIGQGLIAMKGCETIGKYPESANKVRTTMFLAMTLVETGAIYVLIISLVLVFLKG